MLPFLVIGGEEERFWRLTPKTIQLYFEVHKKKLEIKEQEMWLMGQYIRNAIGSIEVITIPLLDEKSARKIKPIDYPECPHTNNYKENNPKWVDNEKQKLILYLNSFQKRK